MRVALVVEYDGADYHGFQYQLNAPSIQGEMEKAIKLMTGESVRIRGAGRTDAGVHALGQVVVFDTASSLAPLDFPPGLNYYLPRGIAVKEAHGVDGDFDPRRSAVSRRYRYTILNSQTPSPLVRRTAHLVREPLNVGRMRAAARLLVGRHDFARFAGHVPNGASTVREVLDARVRGQGDVVTFEVEANAFLPHQVRRMAGALVDVGRGHLSRDQFKAMLEGEDTEAVAHALPGLGLCLLGVTYRDFPPGTGDQNGSPR